MSFVVNLADIKEAFELLPEDEYLASLASAQPGTSNSGHPKIDLQWRIEEGEHEGRQIYDTLSFHPKSMYRVKQTLVALGVDENGEVDVEEVLNELIEEGAQATLVVAIKKSDGVNRDTGEPYPDRNRIVRAKPASEYKNAVPF